MNIWSDLKKKLRGEPILALAPMANVTDSAFRRVVMQCGRLASSSTGRSGPDLFFNEFVSCEGLCSSEGRGRLIKDLFFTKEEKPIIAQFFGAKPEQFYQCAQLAQELGFDGVDINMGCPDRGVEKQGAGAALIKNPKLAQEIIKETKRGAGQLPVSVKTRIGYNKIEIENWIPYLLEMGLDALTIHGRTRKEMSAVLAHWDEIGKVAEMARKASVLVLGNGDVTDIVDARAKAKHYELDGIMIGRGIFANPWFFNDSVNPERKSPRERLDLLRKHVELFTDLWKGDSDSNSRQRVSLPPASSREHDGGSWEPSRATLSEPSPLKNFDVMKKFFKVYVSGFDGSKELRIKLMAAKNKEQAFELIKNL